MSLKDNFRPLLNAISCRYTDIIFGNRHRRFWISKGGRDRLHEVYFDNYLKWRPLAEEIVELIETKGISNPKIIEFGCSGGNNLKLLRGITSMPLEYCGLDIQEDALAFARANFPDATFHKCADTELAELKPKLGHFDIFLISCVSYYIPQKEVQAIFDFAAEVANYVVVHEDLKCFDSPTGENYGLFLHPYRLICRRAGLEIIVPPHSIRKGDRHSVFIARSPNAPR
jgi:Methyltransferase domain